MLNAPGSAVASTLLDPNTGAESEGADREVCDDVKSRHAVQRHHQEISLQERDLAGFAGRRSQPPASAVERPVGGRLHHGAGVGALRPSHSAETNPDRYAVQTYCFETAPVGNASTEGLCVGCCCSGKQAGGRWVVECCPPWMWRQCRPHRRACSGVWYSAGKLLLGYRACTDAST